MVMETKKQLEEFLAYLVDHNGSDLHLKAGSPAHIRVNGELLPIQRHPLPDSKVHAFARHILGPTLYGKLQKQKEYDASYSLDDTRRFRINFFYQINGLSIAFRLIPAQVPGFEELHLPVSLKEFADLEKGLILVTGPTGSGKSTTVAAIIDRINRHHRKHIITIEDPVEFIFREDKSIISQRAVHDNTFSFENALTAAFREDFDVLLLGEIRSLETMRTALHAANTGHLVISTLHTQGAIETINRIINMYPAHEHDQVRLTLAQLLKGVISQTLVVGRSQQRLPAVEILKGTPRITEMIMNDRDSEILEALSGGTRTYGTQTLDQALIGLFESGAIDAETLLAHARNPSDMQLYLDGIR